MNAVETNKLKFLVADDHSLIRQGVVFVIEDLEIDSHIVQVGNLETVKQKVTEEQFDVLVLDAHFPDGNSINVIPEIKEKFPTIKILVFSGVDEHPHALKFLKAGANGFLSKMSDEDQISSAIKAIIEEGEYLSATTQKLLRDSILNINKVDPLSTLSERELEIAQLYAEGYGNLEIANKLDIKQNTVSTIKKRLFDKLKIENIVELIRILEEN